MEKELAEWHKLHTFYQGCDYQTKELADYLKVSCRTIQRWLKGTTQPPDKKLRRIKEYLANKKEKQTS
ncbi:MAG: helix-turn-helix transcriptional regulator [Candidatus Omnitrophota bacterium]|nr:MAG: helix-turn-helix transcriptional regulator [Candidatus Omnitrophota bacterium]